MRRQAFHCVRGAFAIAVRSRSEQPPPNELPLQPLKSVNAAPSLGRTMLAEAPHPLEEPPTSLQSASPTDIAVEPKIDIVGAFLRRSRGRSRQSSTRRTRAFRSQSGLRRSSRSSAASRSISASLSLSQTR